MAWTTVKCQECGKEEEIQLYGPNRDREWKAAHHTCAECRAKAREAVAQVAEGKANDYLAELGKNVPALAGSEKQIAWATSIRADFLLKLQEMHFTFEAAKNEADRNTLERFWEECVCNTSSSWWIDNRNSSPRMVIGDWMSNQAK